MNKKEAETLRAIAGWPCGAYSKYWTPKTNERLQKLGYVTVEGGHVKITMAGIAALAGD